MPTLRRLAAALSAALLLLQSLQGVDRSCMERAGHARASVDSHRAAPAPSAPMAHPVAPGEEIGPATAHRAGAQAPDGATSAHEATATRAAAPDQPADGTHDCCPDRNETSRCATMTGCLLLVALPVADASSGTAQVERGIVAAPLGVPAVVTFSPELPPPRA